jgi:hypothetical protein
MTADMADGGNRLPTFELCRTFMDTYGQQARGLQNRLRGGVLGGFDSHPSPPIHDATL